MANVVFPASMPYDEINIIDQSSYSDASNQSVTPFIPSGPTLFAPFISEKGYGKDNTLEYMTGATLSKFGKPNLKKYGLSLYLAKRFIEGGGTLLGMRVTSSEMHHANAVLVANVTNDTKLAKYASRTSSITGEVSYHPIFTDSNGTEISFEEIILTKTNDYGTISALREVDGEEKYVALNTKNGESLTYGTVSVKLDGAVEDLKITLDSDDKVSTLSKVTDGGDVVETYTLVTGTGMYVYYTLDSINGTGAETIDSVKLAANSLGDKKNNKYAIAAIIANGAGVYGNAYKFRITPDAATNAMIESLGDTAFCYKFIDSDNGVSLDSPFSFSFNDEYLYDNESMAVDEVFETWSKSITMAKLDGYDDFIELVKAACVKTDASDVTKTIEDVNNVDILFGTNVDPTLYYVDYIEDSTKKNVNLSKAIGFALSGGADPTSKFDYSNDPFADALAAAYNGEIDDMIYDQVRYPYQFLFAPSFDEKVTNAIHNLATVNRKGTRASYFVCGSDQDVPKTYDDARTQRLNLPDDSWKEDVTPEWARCTDPYTGRKTYFPSVYWTAYSYPYHWINRKGKPLAGPSHATWTGFDVGTVMPKTASDAQRVANHNARINTMTEDGIGSASLYEQITSQKYTSALSEINNAQILADMVRIALKVANDSRWSDLGDDEVETYKTSVETRLSTEFNGCYDTLSLVANKEAANGAGANRIYCRINVKFKNILKGVTYDFYILAN